MGKLGDQHELYSRESMRLMRRTATVLLLCGLQRSTAFVGPCTLLKPSRPAVGYTAQHAARAQAQCSATTVPALVSLAAGMVGGSIGVGVAYPLDTLKTKQQASAGSESLNPIQLTKRIYRAEGIAGFYGGVSTTMAGQAIIKGALFFVYGAARNALTRTALGYSTLALCLAAAFSGFIGSFVMAPVERVKCVMQAKAAGTFPSPFRCIAEILRNDGLYGLCFRGLGATIAREIPACTFYLVGFDLAKAVLLPQLPRTAALLLSGAFAGVVSWIPVYPIDVVKTQIQIEVDGGSSGVDNTFLGHTRRLWRAGGVLAFWDGIGPKLARAIVNHAVTFLVFDNLCALWLAIA